MCGIVGILDLSRSTSSELLESNVRRMTGALQHRGPDADGIWTDAPAGIALGHRRLAVLDLSPAGQQPMTSVCGRYIISFNGEIYNFADLRAELERDSSEHLWRGRSDTEVLLAAIVRWGVEAAVKRAIGMFAVALWDRREQLLHLVRDRMGEKPIYYGQVGRCFLFGSELKALRAAENGPRTIDRRALALLLRHSYVPGPYSIYEGIRKLAPGSILTIGTDRPERVRAYWSLAQVVQAGKAARFSGSEAEAADELDRLLRQTIRGQMIADVPLGAFLSGGVDSSTVVALMQAQSARPVRTFTIGFDERAYDEARHAKAVARHLGTDHTELYVSAADALAVIPELPQIYDEPFADVSQIPTLLVAGLARRHVTVSLSGDGGDELFGGYNRYFLARSLRRATGWLPRPARSLLARGITGLSPNRWDRIVGGAGRLLPASLRQHRIGEGLHKFADILRAHDAQAMYRHLVSHWKEPTTVVRDAEEAPTLLTDPCAWALRDDYTEQMMYLDGVTYLPDDILAKVDRATMAVSLESRVPLLDPRIVEFAWKLPLSFKVKGRQGKRLLRQVLYKYVPRQLIDRPKMGFGVPLDSWLRGPLREWASALLDPDRLAREGFFHTEPITKKWQDHLSGRCNWQYPLWNVLMFQSWLERWSQRDAGTEKCSGADVKTALQCRPCS